MSRGTSLEEHEFIGVFSIPSLSMISKLFLQISCIKYWFLYLVLSWDFCIMNFTNGRRLPTRWKGQYNTDFWSNSFYIDGEHSLKEVGLKWSYFKRFYSEPTLKSNFKAQTYLQLLSSPHAADGVVQVVLAIFHKLAIACKRNVLQKKKFVGFFFGIKDTAKWTNWWEMNMDTQANCYKWYKQSFLNLVGSPADLIRVGRAGISPGDALAGLASGIFCGWYWLQILGQ